jgi:type I restriction enzyme, S subunit
MRRKSVLLKNGDLIFARRSLTAEGAGKCSIVFEINQETTFESSIIRARLDKKKANPLFIFYYFNSPYGKYLLGTILRQVAVSGITGSDLMGLILNIPSVENQTSIASILSSLDNKIDLLHRQNQTLEKMAETLFRQWFVEEANEDWEEGKVSDLAIHSKGSIPPQKFPQTNFLHYSIPSFDSGKNPKLEMGNEIQSNKYKIPKNCILFSKLNPHKDKRIWLLQDEVQNNSICSTEFQIVQPKKLNKLYFLYGWLNFTENYNEISSGVGGTSGSHQRIDPNSIFSFRCPIIPEKYLEEYNFIIEPIFKRQRANKNEIKTFTALRDTLIPKLMIGEVRLEI